MPRLPFYSAADIAAMSDAGLADLAAVLRNGERVAFATRNARYMRRVTFLLDRMVYPEMNRRAAAR